MPNVPNLRKKADMGVEGLQHSDRVADYFGHIDMGFLNRRLAITALGPLRTDFLARQQAGDDHMTRLANDHRLVTMLIDACSAAEVPPLSQALVLGKSTHMFMSVERLEACPEVYNAERVIQRVHLEFDYGKPIELHYHTEHIVSATGRMTLAEGHTSNYREAIIGLLHDRGDHFQIRPIVIGAPWLGHPRNGSSPGLMWSSFDYGEILPEDIAEFEKMKDVQTSSEEEWLQVMQHVPEKHVKGAIASLLREPSKVDWGGEENDHFSSNLTVGGRRRTAAFLLKGPAKFVEMTPAMCGKNGDQIYRLANSGADISIVQHSHLVGAAVRATLRAFIVQPGTRARKFCVMDGHATYRLLKAYNQLPA